MDFDFGDSKERKLTDSEKFDLGFFQLKDRYPALYASAAKALTPSKKNPHAHKYATLRKSFFGIGFETAGTTTNKATPAPQTTSRPPVDLSNSRLSLLDNPSQAKDPTPILGKRQKKGIKKKVRESTKGPGWFGMTAPEVTDERKNDLEALRLRGALDTKTFYKRNANTLIKPKYFQVGKVVETKAHYYNSRLTKKQRKRNIAEELMAQIN